MIYLRLSGGLGNQLFQYAAMSLLSLRRQSSVTVFIDALKMYQSPRDFDIIKLIGGASYFSVASPGELSIHRWLSVIARAGRFIPGAGVNDRTFWSQVKSAKSRGPLYADGYFQRGWERTSFALAIGNLPVRSVDLAAANRLLNNEVVVHIRGGDFLKVRRFQVVGPSFYVTAAKQCIALGFRNFAVITDDHSYAAFVCSELRNRCPNARFRILDCGATALEDFDTIRSASGRIIGNSTFAWWAAALGASDSLTFSPPKFTVDEARDFFLQNERRVIDF